MNIIRVLILLSVVVHSIPALAEGNREKFKIGAIVALSGEFASIGNACKNGMEIALDSLPSELKERIEVVYEDDQLKAKNSVAAFSKLSRLSGVDAVITLSSGTSKAVSPMADKSKVPLLAIASDPSVVKDRKFVFNVWVTPEEQSKLLLQELAQRGIKRVARIVAIHDGAIAIKEAFDAQNKGQVEIVLDEEYPVDVKDFRPFLNKLKQRDDIDAIFVEVFFGQTGLFARQARELGLQLPLFNIETFEDPTDLELSQGALVGHWYIQADDPGDQFIQEYSRRFPKQSNNTAGNCHDAILLLADALQKQKTSNTELQQYLFTLKDFSGAMGRFSATGDNRFSFPAVTKIVTDDGFKKLDQKKS